VIKVTATDLINKVNQKKYREVIELVEKILKKKKDFFLYNIYGIALQNSSRVQDSIEAFKKSLILNNNNLDVMNNLANSYKIQKEYHNSEKIFKKILKINPNFFLSLLNYSNLKQELMLFNEAIEFYNKALSLAPSKYYSINILFNLSTIYEALGKFKKARECAEQILILEPENSSAHRIISKSNNYFYKSENLNKMISILKKNSLPEQDKIELNFALGKAYEDLKEFDKSFKFYENANKLRKKTSKYIFEDHLKLHNSIINFFENFDFTQPSLKDFGTKILFIIGMPRSGTSLTEVIISSHQNVVSTGESNFLNTIIQKNFLSNFVLEKKKIFNEAKLSNNLIQTNYLKMLSIHNIGSKVITDKTIQNYLWVGFIKIFFPNSKIIICNRNPKDICTSIYKINFNKGFMDWSYDQKDIVNFYNLYSELISFWRSKFTKDIYNLNYENLIKNSEIEIKKLISFCELDWDNNCLNHIQNNSAINTASNYQARKPIYNSSINNYKMYEKYLYPMFELIK